MDEKFNKGHNLCKICKENGIEKTAVPAHVVAAHAMSWEDYKKEIKDPKFIAKVKEEKKKRSEKEVEEFHANKILLSHWFRADLIPGLMRGFIGYQRTVEESVAHKAVEVDTSKYAGEKKVYITDLLVAEALLKTGEWKTLEISGGGSIQTKDKDGRIMSIPRKQKTWVLERV